MSNATTSAAFHYSGDTKDREGKSVSGVEVTATLETPVSTSYIDVVKTDVNGHFLINRKRALSGHYADRLKEGVIRLRFSHPDYAYVTLEDLRTYSSAEATHLLVTLPEGREVRGQVVSANRQPVGGAAVEITFLSGHEQRRGTMTDAQGQFTFRGLPEEVGTIRVLTVAADQPLLTAQAEVAAIQNDAGTIVVTPIALPEGSPVHELFGMKLINVDVSLQAAFHLWQPDGVLVLDPGNRGRKMNLQRGDQFWIVGNTPVKNFADFASKLLTLRNTPDTQLAPNVTAGSRVRVVWNFKRPDFAGTNTHYMELDSTDVSALTALQKN